MDIKILQNLLQETVDRCNLRNRHNQVIQEDYGQSWSSQEWQSGAAPHDGSGKPENFFCKKLPLIMKNIFSAGMRILQGTERLLTIERGYLCQRIFKKMQIPKISSWAVTQQNF